MTRHPRVDSVISRILYYLLYPLRVLYSTPPEDEVVLHVNAKNDILINSKVGIRVAVAQRPPSDVMSAFRGALAFVISVTADIIGTFMYRKK